MNTTQHPLLFARATRPARVLQYGAEVQDAVSGVVVAIDATTGIAHLLTETGEVLYTSLSALRFDAEAVRKVAEKADERAIAAEEARRRTTPTLAELEDDCRRAGDGPENILALIKAYRARCGCSLREASDYVKSLLAARDTTAPDNKSTPDTTAHG